MKCTELDNVISPLMAWRRYSVSWIIFFPFPQTRTCTWLKTLITMLEEPEIHTCTCWNSAQDACVNASDYMYCMWVQKPCKYDAGTLKILPETRKFGWVEGWKKNLTGHMRKAADSHSHRSKELLSFSLSDKDLVILQWIISIGLRVSESSQHTVC